MSATDSDNSIDWLASDYEDNESDEQEFDCGRRQRQTEAPGSPGSPQHLDESDSSSEVKEGGGRGSPPAGCTETWDSTIGLYKTQQGEKADGKTSTQKALKRPRSSAEEERRERQLISNMSEKNRTLSRKVSVCVCCI